MHKASLVVLCLILGVQLSDAFGFGGGGGGGGGCGMSCGGGCGRKKRDVSQVRGQVTGTRDEGPTHSQCNSKDLSDVIKQYLPLPSDEARTAIHARLSKDFDYEDFAVFCAEGPVSYIADSESYCSEGNAKHNCYVFTL